VSIIQSHDSRHNGDVDEAEVQRESADNENTTTRQNEKTNQKALKKTRRRPIVIVEDNINRQMKDCVRKIIEKSEIGGIKKTSVEKSTYETTSSSEQQSKRNEKRPNNADAVARLEQPNNNTALSPAVTDSLMAAPAPAATSTPENNDVGQTVYRYHVIAVPELLSGRGQWIYIPGENENSTEPDSSQMVDASSPEEFSRSRHQASVVLNAEQVQNFFKSATDQIIPRVSMSVLCKPTANNSESPMTAVTNTKKITRHKKKCNTRE
jgi:hypothetical protein